MAYDRIIQFSKAPAREEVRLVIEDFLSDAASEIQWDRDRFFVTLIGKNTHPLKRIPEAHWTARAEPEPGHEGRHLEVWVTDTCVDVITRSQDEYTHAVAEGLAKVLARFWQGKRET